MSNAWAAGTSSAGVGEATANLRARVLAAASPKAILLTLVAILQLADIATTNTILAMPTGGEGNPVMAYAQHALGSAWPIPKLLLMVGVIAIVAHARTARPAAVLLAMYALTVANNAAIVWLGQ